jgi:hypothetical protein
MIKLNNEDKSGLKNIPGDEKISRILEELNLMSYKIEGEDEILLNMRGEKYNLIESNCKLENILNLLYKYVGIKLESKFRMIQHPTYPAMFTENFGKAEKLIFVMPDISINCLGVFSNSALIYNGVKKGSMYNFVELGVEKGYQVMIINPNKLRDSSALQINPIINKDTIKKSYYSILKIIWCELISPLLSLNKIIIVAQKNSCISLFRLMSEYKEDFLKKVTRIVLINSSPFKMYKTLNEQLRIMLENRCINYVPSNLSAGTLIYSSSESGEGMESRSCGRQDEQLSHVDLVNEIAKFLS